MVGWSSIRKNKARGHRPEVLDPVHHAPDAIVVDQRGNVRVGGAQAIGRDFLHQAAHPVLVTGALQPGAAHAQHPPHENEEPGQQDQGPQEQAAGIADFLDRMPRLRAHRVFGPQQHGRRIGWQRQQMQAQRSPAAAAPQQ